MTDLEGLPKDTTTSPETIKASMEKFQVPNWAKMVQKKIERDLNLVPMLHVSIEKACGPLRLFKGQRFLVGLSPTTNNISVPFRNIISLRRARIKNITPDKKIVLDNDEGYHSSIEDHHSFYVICRNYEWMVIHDDRLDEVSTSQRRIVNVFIFPTEKLCYARRRLS
eukprot:CAMPEP_0170178158 /NCGR_PEP_ID=MMETSP0040_2-20121228/11704_1 /TAXON_ID=641309 /ORGANISM="Lotharella oceanica, Strain CCMP622" /LENGTH=166 /DNA_ID=CAMNT_0010421139 /DNA_START=30 /DNA_END=527 /DNA_ORIENTATION=+